MPKVVCREAVHVATKKGGLVSSLVGRTYSSTDPIVKAAPLAFVSLDEWAELSDRTHAAVPVEATTAAPNETRETKKPAAKKPAAKK